MDAFTSSFAAGNNIDVDLKHFQIASDKGISGGQQDGSDVGDDASTTGAENAMAKQGSPSSANADPAWYDARTQNAKAIRIRVHIPPSIHVECTAHD